MAEEVNNGEESQTDPADLLAGMAAEQAADVVVPDELESAADPLEALSSMSVSRSDPAEGLDRLAAGQDPSDQQGRPDQPPADAEDDGGIPLAPETGQALTGQQAFRARRARSADLAAMHARAHAHTYKKTMIPFLLVVAVLLVVVGFISSGMVLPAAMSENERANPWMTMIALVSFPMAGVLLVGAWLFYRDVKK